MLYTKTVDNKTLAHLEAICDHKLFNSFYLAGGTALALQIGHRISIDLDFFCPTPFEVQEIEEVLSSFGPLEILNSSKNSLQTFIGEVKVDFLTHQYPLLKEIKNLNKIRLAAIEDIAAMKLNAIKNRGAKKDFYDIFFLLNHFSLKQLIEFFKIKYPHYNTFQLLKSLIYFSDAENQPRPNLISHKTTWIDVKTKLSKEVQLNFG